MPKIRARQWWNLGVRRRGWKLLYAEQSHVFSFFNLSPGSSTLPPFFLILSLADSSITKPSRLVSSHLFDGARPILSAPPIVPRLAHFGIDPFVIFCPPPPNPFHRGLPGHTKKVKVIQKTRWEEREEKKRCKRARRRFILKTKDIARNISFFCSMEEKKKTARRLISSQTSSMQLRTVHFWSFFFFLLFASSFEINGRRGFSGDKKKKKINVCRLIVLETEHADLLTFLDNFNHFSTTIKSSRNDRGFW